MRNQKIKQEKLFLASRFSLLASFFLIFLLLPQAKALAATYNVYYLDPVNGNINNDGSYDSPWPRLSEVWNAGLIGTTVGGGDVLRLRSGYHGSIYTRQEFTNSDYITIEAQDGHTPELSSFRLQSANKWIIRGLHISPELNPAGYSVPQALLRLENHGTWGNSEDVIIENCTIYRIWDSSTWSATDWVNNTNYAIQVAGSNIIIRNNYLKNIGMGILSHASNSLIEYNTIENFAADGIRPDGGDDTVIQYNVIKNCYDVDDNHDDGIQVYSGGGYIRRRVIRGNIIINYEDVNQPFRGPLQGMLLQDDSERFYDWIIENNIVIVNSYHGIRVAGMADSKIVNNIVVPVGALIDYPSISVGNAGGRNLVFRNNIAPRFPSANQANNIIVDHNLDFNNYNPDDLFVDYENNDLHHAPGGPAIDAGSLELAPNVDIDGNSRPQGYGYDIGAYEYVGSVSPGTGALYGDVSGNGEISAYDAALAAQYAVGLISLTPDQIKAADVSGNSEVSAYDAALIAQRAVGLIERFPIGQQQQRPLSVKSFIYTNVASIFSTIQIAIQNILGKIKSLF